MRLVKRLSILLYCIFLLEIVYGQTVLLHESIRDYDFAIPKQGPNFRNFNHLYIGFAFFIPLQEDNEIETKTGSTTIFSVGWRYKYKLTNWLAIGTGINYTNEIFNLKQNKNKLVPDTVIHKKEKLRFNYIGTDAYLRFNFGKRGNIIGRFVDIGAFCGWAFSVKDEYQDNLEQNPLANAGVQRVVLTKLNYIEKFQYGLKARIGINRFVLTGTYRLTELLTSDYKEKVGDLILPKLAVGLEIGLHK